MSSTHAATADSIRALAKDPPKDIRARQDIYEAARELMFSVEPSSETDNRLFFAYAPSSITQIAVQLRLFEILAADSTKPWKVDALAKTCGADPLLLHRLLRYLSGLGLVKEVSEGTYSASHQTLHLATPGFVAGIKHTATFVNTSFAALPEFLAETNYRSPFNIKATAFQKALNTDYDVAEYLRANPDKAAYTFQYMAAHKAASPTWMDGTVPINDFKLSSKDIENGRVMLVDVGGGSGHQSIDLRKAFPELKGKMIVQDMAVMINMIDKEQAKANDLEPMAHDFFTPQPVKGAKVYYMRNVLHDWPDETCKIILKHLRDAMAEDSVVIVDESIVPKTGASLQQMHMDLTMMACVAAMERSEKQWQELFDAVGLKIRDVWIYDKNFNSSLIVGVPV